MAMDTDQSPSRDINCFCRATCTGGTDRTVMRLSLIVIAWCFVNTWRPLCILCCYKIIIMAVDRSCIVCTYNLQIDFACSCSSRMDASILTVISASHKRALVGCCASRMHLSCRLKLGEQPWRHKSCSNVSAACRMRWRGTILPGLHMLLWKLSDNSQVDNLGEPHGAYRSPISCCHDYHLRKKLV